MDIFTISCLLYKFEDEKCVTQGLFCFSFVNRLALTAKGLKHPFGEGIVGCGITSQGVRIVIGNGFLTATSL